MTITYARVRLLGGRGEAHIAELASVLWLLHWCATFVLNPTLMAQGSAWRLLRHVPQPTWAAVCLVFAAIEIAGFLCRPLARPARWLAGIAWLVVGGSFIVSQPWTTILAPVLTLGFALVYLATGGAT